MKIKQLKIINQDESTEIADIGANAENVDYNDTNVKLKLDELSNNVDTNTTNISNEITTRANSVASLQSQIRGLASGSPKGTYATVAALTSANPDTGVYIVTANGHIYSWVKNGSSAIDLGVYQAASFETLYNINSTGALTNGSICAREQYILNKMHGLTLIPVTERGFKYNIGTSTVVNDLEAIKEANASWEYSKYNLVGGEDLFLSSWSKEYSARKFFILDSNGNVLVKAEQSSADLNKNSYYFHVHNPENGRLLVINNQWTQMPNPLNYISQYRNNNEYTDFNIEKMSSAFLRNSIQLDTHLCIELTNDDDSVGSTLQFTRSYNAYGSSLVMDVTPGDLYYARLRYYIASNKKLGVCIYFTDDEFTIIGKAIRKSSYMDIIIKIPENATKVVLNSQWTGDFTPCFAKIDLNETTETSLLKTNRDIQINKLLLEVLNKGYSLVENPTIELDSSIECFGEWLGTETWTVGKPYTYTSYLNKEIGINYTSYRYSVTGGEIIAFIANGGSFTRQYAILDGNNEILEVAPEHISGITILQLPMNARSILFNVQDKKIDSFRWYPFEVFQIQDSHSELKDYRTDMIYNYNINLNAYNIGDVVSLTPERVKNWHYIIFNDINENTDAFYIKGAGGTNPRLWGCLDKDNKLLSKAWADAYLEGKIPLAKGTKTLIINFSPESFLTGYIYDKEYEKTSDYMKLEIEQLQDKLPMDTYNNTTANSISEENIYNYIKGLRLASELNNHITDFKKPGDKMVHVSTFAIINDIVYMTYYVNTRNSGETPSEHTARFVYCSLNDLENKTYIDLQDVGEVYDGKVVTALYDTILLRKDDNELYLMWTAALDGVYYRLYRTYNIETGVLGPIMTNQFQIEDTIVDFSSSAMNSLFAQYGISHKSLIGDIGIMQKLTSRVENGETYYYTGCYIGPFNCIIKSKDLITWEFVAQPDFPNNSQWENAVYVKNDKAYYFVRQYTNSNTGFLTYYDLNSKTWAKPVFIFDSQSRADFFEWNGNLYMLHAPRSRNYIGILKINTTNLYNSYDVEIAKVPDYFYPYCQIYNNELYMSFTQSRQHIWLSKFTIGTPDDTTINNKFKELFNLN